MRKALRDPPEPFLSPQPAPRRPADLIQTRMEIENHREFTFFNKLLGEHYTRTFLDAVSGYVRRTLELSRIESSETPSPLTNTYIREATRAYILGLPQACIALCRAALEQDLKERLGYQLTGTFIGFRICSRRPGITICLITSRNGLPVMSTMPQMTSYTKSPRP